MQARDCSSVDYSQPGRELRFQIACTSTEASRCSTFSLRHSSVPGSSSAADPAAIPYRKAVASACPDARLQIMAPRKLSPAPTTLTGLIGMRLSAENLIVGDQQRPLFPQGQCHDLGLPAFDQRPAGGNQLGMAFSRSAHQDSEFAQARFDQVHPGFQGGFQRRPRSIDHEFPAVATIKL